MSVQDLRVTNVGPFCSITPAGHPKHYPPATCTDPVLTPVSLLLSVTSISKVEADFTYRIAR